MSSGNQKLPQKENGIFKKVVVSVYAHLGGPSCVGELEIVSQARTTSAKKGKGLVNYVYKLCPTGMQSAG